MNLALPQQALCTSHPSPSYGAAQMPKPLADELLLVEGFAIKPEDSWLDSTVTEWVRSTPMPNGQLLVELIGWSGPHDQWFGQAVVSANGKRLAIDHFEPRLDISDLITSMTLHRKGLGL